MCLKHIIFYIKSCGGTFAYGFAQAFAQLDGDGDGRVMPSELAEFLGVDLAAGAEAEGAIGETLRGWPAEGVTLREFQALMGGASDAP